MIQVVYRILSCQLVGNDLVKTKTRKLTTEFLSMKSSKAVARPDKVNRNSRIFITILSNGLLTMFDVEEKDNMVLCIILSTIRSR